MYSAALLDHFEHPRNSGELPDADVRVSVSNPACGDVMELALKFDGDRIVAARFKTRGCVAAIACGSAVTELVIGKSRAEAAGVKSAEIARIVGGLPPASGHAAELAVDAVRAALSRVSRP